MSSPCSIFSISTKSTGVCSHDHAHGDHDHHDCDHEHHHDHDDEHVHEPHFHDESTASSLAFALLILLVPLLMATKFSQDRYSVAYVKKWDEIEREMKTLRHKKKANKAKAQQIAANENPYANPNGTAGNGDSKGSNGNGDSDGNSENESANSGGGEEWGEFTLADLKKMVPQTSEGDFLLDIPQIFYTAGDEELMRVMEGISIKTKAQIIEETAENAPSNRLRAYRLLIECCAADARPLSIRSISRRTFPSTRKWVGMS